MDRIQKIKEICQTMMDVDLSQRLRSNEIVFCRYIYFKVCKEIFPLASLRSIGEQVDRNHATVLHGLRCFNQDIEKNVVLNKTYNDCLKRCNDVLKKHDRKIVNMEDRINELTIQNELLKKENHEFLNQIKNIYERASS